MTCPPTSWSFHAGRGLTGSSPLRTIQHFMSHTGFSFRQCSAIITGASSGLGTEFARQLAPHANALLLAARRLDALEAVEAELLAQRPGLTVHCCACDLATTDGRAALLTAVDSLGLAPNLLINNASKGDYGNFAEGDVERATGQIDLNVTALVTLSHAFIPKLRASAAEPAGILNVSSLAGNVPMPDLAVYAATKSFVTSFSEALRIELLDRHIVVTAVCPGPTPTNFGKNARRPGGVDTNRDGQDLLRIPTQQVVAQGLAALGKGQASVFPGGGVSLVAPLFRIMPRAIMRWAMERRYRKENA
ncbi:MAG: isfD [Verrucomicrobiaceae bacterium]|nr:isfD [Verrucomicrobiaceae bacterium]